MQQASGKPLAAAGLNFETIYQGVSQVVAVTTSTGQSAALQPRTSVVRLVASAAMFVQIGLSTDNSASGPLAVVTTSMFLPANVPMIVGVPAGPAASGATTLIAAIVASSTASLYITEGA